MSSTSSSFPSETNNRLFTKRHDGGRRSNKMSTTFLKKKRRGKKKKMQEKKETPASRVLPPPTPMSGDWVFSSSLARTQPVDDLSRTTDLLDLAAIQSLVHTAPIHRHKRGTSDGMRMMREIKHRLGLDDSKRPEWARRQRLRRNNQKEEREIAKRMASDMHMSVEDVHRFEHLEDDIEGDEEKIEEECREAFERFDSDGSGGIEKNEIEAVLRYVGQNLSKADVERMRKQADADGDGVVSYEEFVAVVKARRRILALTQSMVEQQREETRSGHTKAFSSKTTTKTTKTTTAAKNSELTRDNTSGIGGTSKRSRGKRKRQRKRRVAPELPELRIPGDIQSRRNMRTVDTFLPRPTPKCLGSGNWTTAAVLRRELKASKDALEAVDAKVKRNVEWVRAHCPVTNIRAQLFCKRWGMEKLERLVKRILHAHMRRAMTHWQQRVQFEKCEEKAAQFLKLRGSRLLLSVVRNHERGQVLKAWTSWCDEVRRQTRVEQDAAASVLQSSARGFLVRRRLLNARMFRAATMVQKHYRGRLGWRRSVLRREEIMLNGAAVEIGRHFRGHQARKVVGAMQLRRKERNASETLQRSWRVRISQKRVTKLREERTKQVSATAVQCAWRSRHARIEVTKLRRDRQERRAATSIQNMYRGRVARACVSDMREERCRERAALVLQCAHRGEISRRRVNELRSIRDLRTRAATTLQSRTRTFIVRSRVARRMLRESSAIAIQSAFRCQRARDEMSVRRIARDDARNGAARLLQRIRRGSVARTQVTRLRVKKRREKRASVSIQSRFRGHRQRMAKHMRTVENMKRSKAALNIQAWYRGCTGRFGVHVKLRAREEKRKAERADAHKTAAQQSIARRKQAEEELAAIRLQSQVRGHFSRRKMEQIRANRKREADSHAEEQLRLQRELAATKLQSTFRMRIARRHFAQEREDRALDAQKRTGASAVPNLHGGITNLLLSRKAEERARQIEEEMKAQRLVQKAAKERHAAVHVQAIWRGRHQKNLFAKQLKDHREKIANEEREARKVAEEARCVKADLVRQAQERARKESEKLQKKLREHAAVRVQCIMRRSLARKRVRARKDEIVARQEREREMDRSALKLQCMFRSHNAQKEYTKKKIAHDAELAELRKQEAEAEEIDRLKRKQRRELAALKLQSAMRSKWARREAEELLRKKELARKEVARRARENRSATQIQSMIRSYNGRKQFRNFKRQMLVEMRRKRDEAVKAATVAVDAHTKGSADDEWLEYWDETQQAAYWFNPRTQESRWENPLRYDAGYDSAYTAGTATDYDTDNWTDPTSEAYSYGSQVTSYDAGYGGSAYYGTTGGIDEEWTEGVDPSSGQKYYYNTRTGETQWEGAW